MRPIKVCDTGCGPSAGPLLLSTDEARRELGGIGKTTIFAMISTGSIEAVKVGRRTMIVGESCRAYVASLARVKQAAA